MSFGTTLYSKRLYAETVYSGLPGTVMLSDTLSVTDNLTMSALVPLLEAIVMTDAFGANTIKIFDEILTVFDTPTKTGQAQLTDFVLLNEFISPRLSRLVTEWTQRSGQSPGAALSLYSQPLYAQNVYSGTSAITWKAIVRSPGPGFTNFNGHKN